MSISEKIRVLMKNKKTPHIDLLELYPNTKWLVNKTSDLKIIAKRQDKK